MQTLGTPVNDEHVCCVVAPPTIFYPSWVHITLLSAGLNLLLEMLQSFQHSDFATQFHKTYYLNLMQEIFAVMTGVRCHYTVSCFLPCCPVSCRTVLVTVLSLTRNVLFRTRNVLLLTVLFCYNNVISGHPFLLTSLWLGFVSSASHLFDLLF